MDAVGDLRDILYTAELEKRVVKCVEIYWTGLQDVELQKVLYDMIKHAVDRGVVEYKAMYYVRDSIRRKYPHYQ